MLQVRNLLTKRATKNNFTVYRNDFIILTLKTSRQIGSIRRIVTKQSLIDFYVSKKKKNKPKEYKQAPEGTDDKDDEETRVFEHITIVSIPKTTYDKYVTFNRS